MPTLKFKGFPHTAIYRGSTGVWSPGDEKTVSDADAQRLQADFGDAFEAVGSAVAAPKKTRAVKSPTKRGGASKAKKADK
tara:strand:+ start:506 stop:745 length:240 start_codon:yes stop_codon:yes gene_type:complete